MKNKNIPPIFYRTLYNSQRGGSLISTWSMIGIKILIRNYKGSIRIYNISLIIHYQGQ